MFDHTIFVTLSNAGVGVINLHQMQARSSDFLRMRASRFNPLQRVHQSEGTEEGPSPGAEQRLPLLIDIDANGFSISNTSNR